MLFTFVPVSSYLLLKLLGSRDGTLVRAFASHQYGLGSIPGLCVICGLSLLLVLVPAPRVFLPPQEQTFPNSSSTWKQFFVFCFLFAFNVPYSH